MRTMLGRHPVYIKQCPPRWRSTLGLNERFCINCASHEILRMNGCQPLTKEQVRVWQPFAKDLCLWRDQINEGFLAGSIWQTGTRRLLGDWWTILGAVKAPNRRLLNPDNNQGHRLGHLWELDQVSVASAKSQPMTRRLWGSRRRL